MSSKALDNEATKKRESISYSVSALLQEALCALGVWMDNQECGGLRLKNLLSNLAGNTLIQ